MLAILALVAALIVQAPKPPTPFDKQIAQVLEKLTSRDSAESDKARAQLRAAGADGVRLLAQLAGASPFKELSARSRTILSSFEPRGEHIGADLFELQFMPDERARAWAALALANTMLPVVDLLLEQLKSTDKPRRLAAIRCARSFVEHYEVVAPILAPLVDDPDPDVRYWATFALGGLTPTSLPALFHALESSDARVRVAAAEAIEKSFYPYWTDRESADWGGYATWHGLPPVMQLVEMSNEIVPRDGVAPLRKALHDDDEAVRTFAAISFYKLGRSGAAARADLDTAREDSSMLVRFWATHALERMDPDKWSRLRRWAGLLQQGPAAQPAHDADELERLATDLQHEPEWSPIVDGECKWSTERDVRFEAAQEITRQDLELLIERCQSGSADQAQVATDILVKVDHELGARIDKLVRILDDVFGIDGPESKALLALAPVAMPELEHELLRFPRFPMGSPTYVELVGLLVRIGDPALPTLAVGLEHWRLEGRAFSTQALFAAGPKAAHLMPVIVSAWRCLGPDPRVPGASMYWESGPDPLYAEGEGPCGTSAVHTLGPDIVPVLVRALDDSHGMVRMRAAASLAGFEKEGRPAIEALVRRLADDQSWVAQAAAEAVIKIAAEDSAAARTARARLDESIPK